MELELNFVAKFLFLRRVFNGYVRRPDEQYFSNFPQLRLAAQHGGEIIFTSGTGNKEVTLDVYEHVGFRDLENTKM